MTAPTQQPTSPIAGGSKENPPSEQPIRHVPEDAPDPAEQNPRPRETPTPPNESEPQPAENPIPAADTITPQNP